MTENVPKQKQTAWPAILGAAIACLAALIAASSLLSTRGLPNTSDGVLHLFRSLEIADSWRQGVPYPRWAPHFAYGFGYPIFNYVPPLLSYIAGLFNLFGPDMQFAMKLAISLALIAGSVGVFLLARPWFGVPAAALAGTAYALAPYRLFDLYIQGNYPQIVAAAVMPYCLWAVTRLAKRQDRIGYAALALSLALLLLAHNISAMLFMPLLVAYALWQALSGPKRWRRIVLLVTASICGVMLSAFFWLPAFAERGYVRTELLQQGFFDFRQQFLSLGTLLAMPQILDFRCANPYFPMTLGAHLVLLAVPSVSLFSRRHSGRSMVAFLWLSLLAYAAMTLPLAEPLWSALPLLSYTEFPHRLLNVAALPLALLVGAGVNAWTERWHFRSIYCLIVLAVIICGAGPYAFPRKPFIDWSNAQATDVVQYEKDSGAFGTTSAGEYLPLWAEVKPAPESWQRFANQVSILHQDGRSAAYVVQAKTAGLATLPVLYFPEWRAKVNGAAVTLTKEAVTGFVQVPVTSGENRIELRLHDTPARTLAWEVSAAGLFLLILGMIIRRKRDIPLPASDASNLTLALLIGALALLACLVAKVTYFEPETLLFRRESPAGQALPAQRQTAIDFGSQVRLIGYDIQRNYPPQGESLIVTLYWQPLGEQSKDYRSYLRLWSPADSRVAVEAHHDNPGGIPVSHWHPSLYYEDRYEIPLPSDLPAVSYDLQVGLYDVTIRESLPIADGNEAATLQKVQVLYHLPLDIRRFPGGKQYRFGENISLLGYYLPENQLQPEQTISLDLYWRSEMPTPTAWKRFVHLVGPDGQIVAQQDEWPVGGLYPTDRWLPKHNLLDRVTLDIPAGAKPGNYSLVLGFYDAATLTRPSLTENGQPVAEGAIHLPVHLTVK